MSFQNGTPTAATAAGLGHRPPRRGPRLRSKIADSTLVQAAIAGALSFTHIRDVAMMGGQTGWKGWAYPLIVDLVTVSAYRNLKRNQAAGGGTALPWTWLIIGTAVSISANIIDAIVHAPVGASTSQLILCIVVGVWPAVAFFGTMLLRHSGKPAERPAAVDRPSVDRPPVANPTRKPAARPTTTIVRPANGNPDTAARGPRPIPVRQTGKPTPFGDLGPRAALGELPLPVWVRIGQPTYLLLRHVAGDRPTERALQDALSDDVARLIADGILPAAIGRPSLSTVKRVRRAIEEAHPEVKAITAQPRRLAAITA